MATFDYQAARAAGATDEQIAAFLKSEEAEGRVIGIAAAPTGRVSGAPVGPSPGAVASSMAETRGGMAGGQLLDLLLSALPAAGGAAGGLMGLAGGTVAGVGVGGLPGAMAGAGAGGAGGEAVRQLLARQLGREAPETPGEALGGIGREAAVQVGSEAAGAGLARGATAVGGRLMKSALRPTGAIQKRAASLSARLGREVTPEGLAIRERVPVGRIVGKPGSTKATGKIEAAAGKLDELLAEGGRAGKTYTAFDFVGPVADLRKELGRQSDAIPALTSLDKKLQQFIAARRGPAGKGGRMGKLDKLTPAETNELKRTWQQAADKIYKAREGGAVIGPRQDLSARFNESVARGARESLEDIPGVADQNALLSELMLLRDAVKAAEMRGASSGPSVLPPAVNWLIPGALRSPALTSRAALGATHPATADVLRQSPRAIELLLEELLMQDQQGGRP